MEISLSVVVPEQEKTFYEVKPNLMQMRITVPLSVPIQREKSLEAAGQMLKNNGYNLKVINLLEMDKSDCYNPFSYSERKQMWSS